MKVMTYFLTSFAVGTGLGNFLLTRTSLFLTPFSFAAGQGNGTPQTLVARGSGPAFHITIEMAVSLLTAALLFAAAYVLWRKYRTVQYFSHNHTHWQTF
jgi:hypothetical protein